MERKMTTPLKDKIRQKIVTEHGILFSQVELNMKDMESVANQILESIVFHDHLSLSNEEKKKIIDDIIDEFIGLGPIKKFLEDPLVSEVMVVGPDKVYVEKNGKDELTGITFESEQHLMHIIYRILEPTRRRVDESYPHVDVSLRDGSRVNIIIPPLALDGPIVTIRKFSKEIKMIEDLIKLDTLDKRMADFLIAAIKAKVNIVFSGATGAGKTTTLNVLSSYISSSERIVTIEDTAELHLNQDHIVRLETRQPNIEGRGEVTIRELFKNSLRMRPDRIILGEIRGGEALDLLQAICSGHTGSLAVIHANSPQDVIYRVETLILTSGLAITQEAIRRQIAAALNLVVQQEQLADGSRKITHITEIRGLNEGELVMNDIFTYDIEKMDSAGKIVGKWIASGIKPLFYPKFIKLGIDLQEDIFKQG
jgi:pilus assembly protein CpaF